MASGDSPNLVSSNINWFDNDPCAKELDMSLRCLNEGTHDKNECKDFIKNYDHCRNFWQWIKSVRQKEGVEPAMPPPEEWDHVKQKYLPLLKPPADKE